METSWCRWDRVGEVVVEVLVYNIRVRVVILVYTDDTGG